MNTESTTTRCPHCGASLKKYWHKLTPILVHALVKFKQAVIDKGENHIHLLNDLKGKPYELTRHEWNNFTKLRFHGLAVKSEQSGYWLLTKRGNQFLLGNLEVPSEVLTFRNRVEAKSERLVKVGDVIGTNPYVEDLLDLQYEYADLPEIDVPAIINHRKKRLKKGQKPCPRCGDVLRQGVETSPGKDERSLAAVIYFTCNTCKYDSRKP